MVHKLISAFTQRMHKRVLTKSREFYCRSQVSVWVTRPAAAVIFDHNVTALQLSCNGPLVTEQLWLCSNRGSDITNPPTATSERKKHKRSSNRWREIKAGKQIKKKKKAREKFDSSVQFPHICWHWVDPSDADPGAFIEFLAQLVIRIPKFRS